MYQKQKTKLWHEIFEKRFVPETIEPLNQDKRETLLSLTSTNIHTYEFIQREQEEISGLYNKIYELEKSIKSYEDNIASNELTIYDICLSNNVKRRTIVSHSYREYPESAQQTESEEIDETRPGEWYEQEIILKGLIHQREKCFTCKKELKEQDAYIGYDNAIVCFNCNSQ